MPDCKNCSNKDWKNHYVIAQQRFDKQIARLIVITMIAFFIAVACLLATIIALFKFQMFISQFEYVEETTYTIEQDEEGTNTAIIGENNEVVVNGTDNYGKD